MTRLGYRTQVHRLRTGRFTIVPVVGGVAFEAGRALYDNKIFFVLLVFLKPLRNGLKINFDILWWPQNNTQINVAVNMQ